MKCRALRSCARVFYGPELRLIGDLSKEKYLSTAQWAYDYLPQVFWDQRYRGIYWSVDYKGNPVFDRKHHYAQAFAIYGLAEYYQVVQEPQSLELAKTLFNLLEEHAYEAVF